MSYRRAKSKAAATAAGILRLNAPKGLVNNERVHRRFVLILDALARALHKGWKPAGAVRALALHCKENAIK